MEGPLVSISCITFNHVSFIRECLDGFLAQKTNFAFEIVVYDDKSTDGTSEILQKYSEKFPEIFAVQIADENQYSKGVRGIAYRFNFPRCRGKYIALCEGDDYWIDPLKLQKQVDFLENNHSYSACVHGAKVWDENEKKFSNSNYEGIQRDFDLGLNRIFKDSGWVYPTCSLLMLKAKVRYPDNLLYFTGGDLILIIFLAAQGKIRFMKEMMGVYRIHSGGVYQGVEKNLSFYLDNRIKLKKFYRELGPHLEFKNRFRLSVFRIKNSISMIYLKLKIAFS